MFFSCFSTKVPGNVSLSTKTTDASPFQPVQTGSGTHPSSYSNTTGALSPAVRGANQSAHLAQVIKTCNCTPVLYLTLWRSAQNWPSCSLSSPGLTFSEVSSLSSSMFDTYWVQSSPVQCSPVQSSAVRAVPLCAVTLSLQHNNIHIPCNRHVI